jgi:predicted esterase
LALAKRAATGRAADRREAKVMFALAMMIAAASMESAEPGGHPYRVYWPDDAPRGMVVFLHGVSLDPMEEEGEGIDALAQLAVQRGLIAIVPLGDRMCDFTPTDVERCWNLDAIDDEMTSVRRIMHEVQFQAGKPLHDLEIVGFSNGAYLVAGALQRGLLDGFTRVGIIAGGKVGDKRPPLPRERAPRVFIEVGKDDVWTRGDTRDLWHMFMNSETIAVSYREVAGGHVWNGPRATDFLAWFWDEG